MSYIYVCKQSEYICNKVVYIFIEIYAFYRIDYYNTTVTGKYIYIESGVLVNAICLCKMVFHTHIQREALDARSACVNCCFVRQKTCVFVF